MKRIYNYKCEKCKWQFNISYTKIKNKKLNPCPKCGEMPNIEKLSKLVCSQGMSNKKIRDWED